MTESSSLVGSKSWDKLDKPTFFGALILLALATVPLMIWPEQGALWVDQAKTFLTDELGLLYLALGVAAMGFMVFILFSDIGQIKLGEADDPVEFNTVSWAAMLFCGGIGASILYWSMIEWAFYYQNPPFQLAVGSEEAIRWSATYGIFHWGIIAWSIYLVPALPIAYFFYIRKQPILKISYALLPVLGEKRAGGWLGKLIDMMFIFGLLGGGATTLGLAAPLINDGLSTLFGFPSTTFSQVLVLLVCTSIFAYSAFAGLEKGIQMLSNINFWGALLLLAFVLVAGPTVFMLETGFDALGRMMNNFFMMATWAEPFGGYGPFSNTHFPQDWTIFYWAWWLVFSPSMGLFIARISKGRTIKQMVAGAIFFGSMGCFLFFSILGNYGLSLQLSGELDVVQMLNDTTPTKTIFAILQHLPFSTFVIVLFTLLCIIFTATTFDTISYILASVVQKDVAEEPMRWNRLFWAFALSILPVTLLFMGGLSSLQTAAIVGGLPLLVICVLLMMSIVRAAYLDLFFQDDYEHSVINIADFPDYDPWSNEGMALAKFEQFKDQVVDLVTEEKSLKEDIKKLQKRMRAEALRYAKEGEHSDSTKSIEAMREQMKELKLALERCIESKQLRVQEAKAAKAEFDQLLS
ncbi:BCCT family transporter [Parahaliea sp. F7430]|uniref:BCCT family transporter n=1 Tax=Sediminihaliea albiluteola TaxID=2758564 RepID=A0A7W2TTX1_9GAMM|nr:BCCT family transporter [Sediminihaliea albiluteola]MBA6411824.1 BCCT family transporter [Sediminihaliea albiluteola]